MDHATVYTKTPDGAAEVSRRSERLSFAQRRLLIMIDGQRAAEDLLAMMPAGGFDDALAQLLVLGLIANVDAPDGPGPERDPLDVPTVIPPAAASPPPDMAEAKRRAVRELVERLGPESDALALRIESCRDVAALRVCVGEAARLVSAVCGAAVGQDYLRALRRA